MGNSTDRVKPDDPGSVNISISIPADTAERYGFKENTAYSISELPTGVLIKRSPDRLDRIYVEITNRCNLNCSTCVRNVWNESSGMMETSLFRRILEEAEELTGKENPITVFFGGWGEPLLHPDVFSMIGSVKQRGWRAELISNGTMIDEERAKALIESGLDMLWISMDGASPESYRDVRLGDMLPKILENLQGFRRLKALMMKKLPELGIAFVAMKSNIGDLGGIVDICRKYEAVRLSISNVLPFTKDLIDQRLYSASSESWGGGILKIDFPRIDASEEVLSQLRSLADATGRFSFNDDHENISTGGCPFLNKASVSVRWDGMVSPCTPLFYDSTYYIGDTERTVRECHYGNLNTESLSDIWMNDEYRNLRISLQQDDFSPCTVCNSCEMAESNEDDCFGSEHPACGGCYWKQGFIQCP